MKKKSQSGSAHLVVIILLVVALLGTLGFVYYQNFIVKKDSVVVTPDPEISIPSTPTVDDGGDLKISQWGVKATWNNSYSVNYSMPSASAVNFTTDNLTGECVGSILGTVQRYGKDDLVGDLTGAPKVPASQYYATDEITEFAGHKKIGDYYYVFVSPQAGCYQKDAAGNLLTVADTTTYEASRQVHAMFTTLVAE